MLLQLRKWQEKKHLRRHAITAAQMADNGRIVDK
jgi:hypothetical protein